MVQAILTPKPETVQQAVKAAVLGIILLDAGMAAFARGFWVSLLVVVLLAPALVLGRSLQST
jgi:hypothetical protein